MKFRHTDTKKEEIKLNMTSMIDIVFQLLVFFIMTFKVVAMEGDFNVKMPLASNEAEAIDDVIPDIIYVRLNSGPEGKIASIEVSNGVTDETLNDSDMYVKLTDFVEKAVAGSGDPSTSTETEVEFEIDFILKYSYTVKAIESVSGKVQPDGSVKKLVEKIKFKDANE